MVEVPLPIVTFILLSVIVVDVYFAYILYKWMFKHRRYVKIEDQPVEGASPKSEEEAGQN